MLPRFHAPAAAPDREFPLPAEEARHLTRVLRLKAGDEIAVFDGAGAEYRARVVHAARDVTVVRAVAPMPATPQARVSITLAQAVLKGSSMDDVVRDAVMMGVASLVPLLTDHVTVKAAVVKRTETTARWSRIALSAVKQSRRATIPAIEPPRSLAEWLRVGEAEVKLLFAEPSILQPARPLKQVIDGRAPARAIVLIGPEGGWSAEEVQAAVNADYRPVSLGALTVRAEAMPLAALAALTALWES